MPLDGELELLALENLGVINIEKVAVEHSLNDASNDGDPFHLVLCVEGQSVDPVGNVQGAVNSEGKQIMCCNGLGLASSLQHEELGQNRHRLQPDGEGPDELQDGVLNREQNSHDGSPN